MRSHLALLWLAEALGLNRIAALDVAYLRVKRLNGRWCLETAMLG